MNVVRRCWAWVRGLLRRVRPGTNTADSSAPVEHKGRAAEDTPGTSLYDSRVWTRLRRDITARHRRPRATGGKCTCTWPRSNRSNPMVCKACSGRLTKEQRKELAQRDRKRALPARTHGKLVTVGGALPRVYQRRDNGSLKRVALARVQGRTLPVEVSRKRRPTSVKPKESRREQAERQRAEATTATTP